MRLFISLVLLVSLASSPAWAESCRTAVLLGYWPPTNEMLRPFSTSPRQNPEGWRGRNWRNLGYNVHAYFPEFPPDGDPTNDQIGEPGSVGAKGSDFQVDYQDTSRDFWRIMAVHKPAILITNSRGGEIGWELEAVEGGHGTGDQSAELDWIADRYGQVHLPEQSSVDRRSWAARSKPESRPRKQASRWHGSDEPMAGSSNHRCDAEPGCWP